MDIIILVYLFDSLSWLDLCDRITVGFFLFSHDWFPVHTGMYGDDATTTYLSQSHLEILRCSFASLSWLAWYLPLVIPVSTNAVSCLRMLHSIRVSTQYLSLFIHSQRERKRLQFWRWRRWWQLREDKPNDDRKHTDKSKSSLEFLSWVLFKRGIKQQI